MHTYEEALARLERFANYEINRSVVYAPGTFELGRMADLLERLGNPHQAYPTVHIAGSKGKGSTAAMLESILRASGYRTGLYISPHLHTFGERMQINGVPISAEGFAALVEELAPHAEAVPGVTWFEVITALAFLHFARQRVDVAVIEVGLGGRLDATNVITPLVSVITSLSYEHMAWLGDTLAQIAFEKAGIIKPHVPVICAPQEPEALAVITRACAERAARLLLVGREWQYRPGPVHGGGQSFEAAFSLGSVFHAARDAAMDAKPASGIEPLGGLVGTRPAEASNPTSQRAILRADVQVAPVATADENVGPDAIRPYTPVILRAGAPVAPVTSSLQDQGWQHFDLPLLGRHQIVNAVCALAAASQVAEAGLPLAPGAASAGLRAVRWPGRGEVLSSEPLVVTDGAHNGDSARKLVEMLAEWFPGRRWAFVVGTLSDKDHAAILRELLPHAARLLVTRSSSGRATDPALLADLARQFGRDATIAASVAEALEAALASGHAVCLTGSLSIAAEAREAWALRSRR